MKCKSKEFKVNGMEVTPIKFEVKKLQVFVSNDENGKSLSVGNGEIQFTIPMKDLIKWLE